MFHQGIRLGRIRIENTKTSKEALALEKTYFPKIKKIFRQIVKEYADGSKFHFLYEAERRYGEEIRTIIKSLVTQTYLLGMDYIARATNKPYYISISQNDVTQILIRSDEAYRMFWRLVTKYLQVKRNRIRRQNTTTATTAIRTGQVVNSRMDLNALSTNDVLLTDEMFQVSDWEDDRLLDEDTNAQLIINGIVTTTLALSTLQKYNEFKKEQKIIFEEGRQQELLLEETLLTLTEEEGEIAAGGADTFIFATENDAKVCDICASLEGMEWDVDDPSIVIPRDDTHPNCRCRLLLRINGNIKAK